MRQRATAIGIVLICTSMLAAQPAYGLPVDQAEVMRLGDSVQHIDGLQAGADAWREALAPPANDADKWFISVITTRNCTVCERLKHDFQTSPWLRALVDPQERERSWAHYNKYI